MKRIYRQKYAINENVLEPILRRIAKQKYATYNDLIELSQIPDLKETRIQENNVTVSIRNVAKRGTPLLIVHLTITYKVPDPPEGEPQDKETITKEIIPILEKIYRNYSVTDEDLYNISKALSGADYSVSPLEVYASSRKVLLQYNNGQWELLLDTNYAIPSNEGVRIYQELKRKGSFINYKIAEGYMETPEDRYKRTVAIFVDTFDNPNKIKQIADHLDKNGYLIYLISHDKKRTKELADELAIPYERITPWKPYFVKLYIADKSKMVVVNTNKGWSDEMIEKIESIIKSEIKRKGNVTICFDLDGTLVTTAYPGIGDPIDRNVDTLKSLKARYGDKFKIHIFTARIHSGDGWTAKQTKEALDEMGIPYDSVSSLLSSANCSALVDDRGLTVSDEVKLENIDKYLGKDWRTGAIRRFIRLAFTKKQRALIPGIILVQEV